jgi:3-oxoacyl-(acyl-carrier-protein) synthase
MQAYIRSSNAISPQDTYSEGIFKGGALNPASRIMKCVEPEYKEIINPALIRRMSRVVKMGVAAALQSLKAAGIEKPDAIITGTGLGCMEDTSAFLSSLIKNKEQFLTPTAFIQSTHNTIAGQIALLIKCNNYNFAYVHRGFSFESALLDAMMMLDQKEANYILAGGIDELTADYLGITSRMGMWKTEEKPEALLSSASRGTIAGEGSVFFVLQSGPDQAIAAISGLDMLYKPENTASIGKAVHQMLEKSGISMNDIDAVMMGNNGNPAHDKWYRQAETDIFKGKAVLGFKHLCGEYMTASSFACWLSANILHKRMLPVDVQISGPAMNEFRNILIYNHYMETDHSLMLIRQC